LTGAKLAGQPSDSRVLLVMVVAQKIHSTVQMASESRASISAPIVA